MAKKEVTTIDALFGSKTRVKLLHLFLNNPGKAFYVREITRLIDEQINSVRRELANLLGVGVITSSTAEHKLYYEVNQQYDFYQPFRAIFVAEQSQPNSARATQSKDAKYRWVRVFDSLGGVRIVVASGALVAGSASEVDLLIVGKIAPKQLERAIAKIEQEEGRSINYTTMPYDEFYYRLSVRDMFIGDILSNRHVVAIDVDKVLAR